MNRSPAPTLPPSAPPYPHDGYLVASSGLEPVLPEPLSSLQDDSSREAIVARGGYITPANICRKGLDVDILVRDTKAGEDQWQAFASSRLDLLRASQALAGLEDLQPLTPHGRLSFVLPTHHAEPEAMGVLVEALDHEVRPSAANSVEVATLIDFMNPTPASRWNRLRSDCQAAFKAMSITDGNWLEQLNRLVKAPTSVVEGWSDGIASHVSSRAALRQQSLACTAEQMRCLLASSAVPLLEKERLAWANEFASRHKEKIESAGAYLKRTGLNEAIRWVDLPMQELQAAAGDGMFTDEQLMNVLAHRMAAQGFNLIIPAFGRGLPPSFQALNHHPIRKRSFFRLAGLTAKAKVSVTEDAVKNSFTATLRLPNFPDSYRGEKLKGPTFRAAGRKWRIIIHPGCVELAGVDRPEYHGNLQCGIYDASFARWTINEYVRSHSGFFCSWEKIMPGLSIQWLCDRSCTFLGADGELLLLVSWKDI